MGLMIIRIVKMLLSRQQLVFRKNRQCVIYPTVFSQSSPPSVSEMVLAF